MAQLSSRGRGLRRPRQVSSARHPKYARLRRPVAGPSQPPADPVESPPPFETYEMLHHRKWLHEFKPSATDEILCLRKRLHELEFQGDQLIQRVKQLKESIDLSHHEIRQKQLVASPQCARRSTLHHGVIPFVAEIVKANRLFDFKKAAKDKYQEKFNNTKDLHPLDIADVLFGDQELKLKFGDAEFQLAASVIYCELEDEKRSKQEEKLRGDVQTSGFKREDLVLDLPIYDLVLRAREQGFVMDQNPEVELERIMKSMPSLYDGCFRLEVPPEDYLTAIKEAYDNYSEFWSKYFKAAGGAEPSVVKAEDEDCIIPSPGTDGSGEYQVFEVLNQKLKKQLVEKELWDVKCQKVFNEMRSTITALRESERRSTLPYAVIPFVAEIEKANRYFEFKKAVKEKYRLEFSKPMRPFDIADILRVDDELNSKFNKFGDLEIQLASHAIYYEFANEKRLKCKVTDTGDLQDRGFKKWEDMALDQPIYKLVFQGRGQCGLMDEEPLVELEKIMKSNTSLYDACFGSFDTSGKTLDGLATAVAEARFKYSEIWSKYFNATKGT